MKRRIDYILDAIIAILLVFIIVNNFYFVYSGKWLIRVNIPEHHWKEIGK